MKQPKKKKKTSTLNEKQISSLKTMNLVLSEDISDISRCVREAEIALRTISDILFNQTNEK